MPIKLNSSGGGSVSIDVPSTASTFTLTAPAKTGNIITSADTGTVTQAMAASTFYGGYGPAFSATLAATQTVTASTHTKINLPTENFDTNSCFDTSLSRFTPNVAGYYLFSGTLIRTSGANIFFMGIYKNGGSSGLWSHRIDSNSGTYAINYHATAVGLIYLNGTTDYVEAWGYTNLTNWDNCTFTGFLARPA